MTEQDDGLLGIEVDADDYADAAADEAPGVSRTYQGEEAYQAEKASYNAKLQKGNVYGELLQTVPLLRSKDPSYSDTQNGKARVKLTKKDVQLLGYAVGELYYDQRYNDVIDLCNRVRNVCEVDSKLGDSLQRWTERCEERVKSKGHTSIS